jgi:DNA polymerase-3 subunit alpha
MNIEVEFTKYCKKNKIDYHRLTKNVYTISNTIFVLISYKEKIIDQDFNLIVDSNELDLFESCEAIDQKKYLIFYFGKKFYYTAQTTDVKLNLFEYIGKNKDAQNYDFVNLGIQTEYNLLKSTINLKRAVKKIVFNKQTSVGICDNKTLASSLKLQLLANESNIKFCIGYTLDVKCLTKVSYKLKLYVANEQGFKNLNRINYAISISEDKTITEQDLSRLCSGLIFVITPLSKFFSNDITDNQKRLKTFSEVLFYDCTKIYYQLTNFYTSDQTYNLFIYNQQKTYLNNHIAELDPIFIPECAYIEPEDYTTLNNLKSIGKVNQKTQYDCHIDDANYYEQSLARFFNFNKTYNGFTAQQIIELSFSNTLQVDKLCTFEFNTNIHRLPRYRFIEEHAKKDTFIEMAYNGLFQKISDPNDKYFERLDYELQTIINAGFADYFLILKDIIEYARTISLVGIGRGSVGGSLLAFCLNITNIDPVKYDLLFERFLNPTRISGERAKQPDALPDIDFDVESSKRDQIKDYINKRFGMLNTCSLGTYTRLKLKASIKDLARVYGHSFAYINSMTKYINNQIEYSIEDLFKSALQKGNEQLYDFVQKNYDLVNDLAIILNNPRAASIHPSAMLVLPYEFGDNNNTEVFDFLPVKQMDGKIISEFEGKYTDRLGVVKEDVLGISQLDKFKAILSLIDNKKLNIDTIQTNEKYLHDKKTFDLFKKGLNVDVFQFNSAGLQVYCREALPNSLEDISAINALYRPGPMKSNAHKDFVLIRRGEKKPSYDFKLKEITLPTFGLYVYQEQIMKSVHVLGKLTLSESDEVRTVIKKFDKKKMQTFQEKFLQGAVQNGCNANEANIIWEKLKAFSGYGFNRSHSFAYGIITYTSQYLKANYTTQFYTVALNFETEENIEKVLNEIKLVDADIIVSTPEINFSERAFVCDVTAKKIFWSLTKIKGIGEVAVEYILKERAVNKFYSLEDFCLRVNKSKVNKKTIYLLILSGCFDYLEDVKNAKQRRRLIDQIQTYYKDGKFENFETENEFISKQRDCIGYGEIDYKKFLINKKQSNNYKTFNQVLSITVKKLTKQYAIIIGEVKILVIRQTKKGNDFAVLTLVENGVELDVLIWSDFLEDDIYALKKGTVINIYGQVNFDSFRSKNQIMSDHNFKYNIV